MSQDDIQNLKVETVQHHSRQVFQLPSYAVRFSLR